jgi:hypothetical protein
VYEILENVGAGAGFSIFAGYHLEWQRLNVPRAREGDDFNDWTIKMSEKLKVERKMPDELKFVVERRKKNIPMS